MPAIAERETGNRTDAHSSGSGALLVTSLVWGASVLGIYYEQLWVLLAAGPQGWDVLQPLRELSATELPYFREAAQRALSGIVSAMLVVSAMLAAGISLDRWLMPPGLAWYERAVVRFANGAGALSAGLLLLAFAGAYRPEVVRAIVGCLAIAAVAIGARTWRRTRLPDWHRPALGAASAWPWVALTALSAAFAFISALAPETEYDALWYHLELPRRWLAAGRPVDDVHEYISLYPMTWELLFGAALAWDGAVAARLLHWTTLIACGVLSASFSTRALGLSTGWIAAAIFVTAPTVFWEATTAYVDLALAMHGALAAGALWRSTRDDDWRWLALAGVQFGLACATKHLGLVIATVAIGAFVIARFRRDEPGRLARRVVLLSVLTLFVPSPWYVRSWIASGNPVFPEMYAIFKARPPERWNDSTEEALGTFKAHFGRPRTPRTIATLPWDMTMHSYRYGGTLGPFVLLLLPAVFMVGRRQPPARWLLGCGIVYLLIWASPISSYQLRFLVPWWLFMSALIAAAVGVLTSGAARVWQSGRLVTHVGLAAVAFMNLPPFTALHERDREGWTKWLTQVVHRLPIEVVAGATSGDAWLRRQIRSYPAWQFLNDHAPPDARVLTFFGGDHFYAERARLWSEAPAARPVTWDAMDGTGRDVIDGLHRLGITHLLVPQRWPSRTEHHDRLVLLQPEVLSRFPVIFEDFWTAIYRVDAPRRRDISTSGADASREAGLSTDHR